MRAFVSELSRRTRDLGHALLVWLAAALAAVWWWSPLGEAADRPFFDAFTVLSAPHHNDLPIVVLAIDEPSFQELQQTWPFPRQWHAALIDRLREDGARAVAFDVVFAEPGDPAQDQAMADAIARWRQPGGTPAVVLAATRERLDTGQTTLWTEVTPLQRLLDAGAVAGQAGVSPDADFVVRRAPADPDSLSARLAAAQGAPASAADWIRYNGPRGGIDTRSYYQTITPGLLPPGFFKNKLVLVGRSLRTATELTASQADMFNSPFAWLDGSDRLMPGVELHAHLLANRLLGNGLVSASPWWTLGAGGLFSLLLAAFALRMHPGLVAVGTASAAAAGVGLSYAAFAQGGHWASPAPLLAMLGAAYGVSAVWGFVATRRRARHIRQMFAQYVPPEVVSELVAHPELMRLGGETRELTVMFTDLASFTTLAERLDPQHTVAVLTEYFNTMTAIVHRHHGTVDKFIGDAVMAFWGAPLPVPDHARHAVDAAIEMQQAMAAMVTRLQAQGLPPIGMRIGIHSGPAVVGNIGSETRFSYTAIGDTVNLAARLEGANKAFGTGILLSASTAALLGHDAPLLRPLADVVVKGKTAAVRVYTPCNDADLVASSTRQLEAAGQPALALDKL
ncbi:CHASE2 domain-containing protein [Hydrogenophaga defluvii]|uniref:CHASE2 domain-containing protein n=1 Tax=Hydrogenophaga defluvii TaxID=249410 RepID=A0ABW2S833_9BURK